jgi:hypothetical protein
MKSFIRISGVSRPKSSLLRFGVVGLLLVGGVGASAAVVTKNFMAANVVRAEACLTGRAGGNTTLIGTGTPSVAVTSESFLSANGVPMARQTITTRGVKPERTIIGDAFRIRNRCGRPLLITLRATPHNAALAVDGEWKDLSSRVHLSTQATPAPASDLDPPVAPLAAIAGGSTFTDPSVVALWNQTPISVVASAGGVGTLATAATGQVTLQAGFDLQVAIVLDGGSTALPANAVLRLTAEGLG